MSHSVVLQVDEGIATPILNDLGSQLFVPIRQCPLTNGLSKVIGSPGSGFIIDTISNTATYRTDDFIIKMNVADPSLELKTSTHRLLDALLVWHTADGAKEKQIKLLIKDYMKLCLLRDYGEIRKQIQGDLRVLSCLSVKSNAEARKKKRLCYDNVRLLTGYRIKNGYVTVTISDEFFEILKRAPVMYLHQSIFETNLLKHPHSYFLMRKIHEHRRINIGEATENRIAVKSLIKICPKLPSYEKVISKNRSIHEAIIMPFLKDFRALNRVFIGAFINRHGSILSETEFASIKYEDFVNLLISIRWSRYPDQSKLIQARAERKAKAKTYKTKRIKNAGNNK